MKKLFFILSLFALCAFTSKPPVVATLIESGDEITVGTTETEYEFADYAASSTKEIAVFIECNSTNSGTIQFSARPTVSAAKSARAASSKIVIGVYNGFFNLRAKGSGAGQKFTVTVLKNTPQ